MLRTLRLFAIVALVLLLAWPAGLSSVQARKADAGCPSRPAAEALEVCVVPALGFQRGAPGQSGTCDVSVIALVPALLPPVSQETRIVFLEADTALSGVAPRTLDPPPRR